MQYQHEVKLNVLLFTLPSNVKYITDTLVANHIYLLDPLPPYDPNRHNDKPDYHNGHGSGEKGMILSQRWQREQYSAATGGYGMSAHQAQMDKATQIEVQRKQVDEVFESLRNSGELEVSSPGMFTLFDEPDDYRSAGEDEYIRSSAKGFVLLPTEGARLDFLQICTQVGSEGKGRREEEEGQRGD
jgi:hypothetical protein